MKISKITKILPIALAMSMCGAFAAQAADYSADAQVIYSLNLEDYVKISTTTENLSSDTTYGSNYSTITITDMSGVFNVISNAPSRTMELTASCPGTTSSAMYNYSDSGFNLIFTKTTATDTSDAVANIVGSSVDADSNPNAIAFTVTTAKSHAHGPSVDPLVATFDDGRKITYTMKNGVADLTYTVTGSNIDGTFNTQDESGTYQATLTLTDKSHT